MTPGAMAQLLIILAPLLKEGIIEGNKLITTFRADLSADELRTALQASCSATWPELDFSPRG
ncbi:MAG: hypothetical protein WA003_01910 [Desulfuromonadaceae bacterium]